MTITDEALIDKMQAIRADNNAGWMDIVRVALRADPAATRTLLRDIATRDDKVRGILEALGKGR